MSVAVQASRLDVLAAPVSAARSRAALRWALALAGAALFFALEYNPGAAWTEEGAQPSEAAALGAAQQMARSAEQGTLQRQVPVLLLGLAGGLALLRRGGARLRARGAAGWVALAYLGLLAASVLWSGDPLLSGRRLLAFALMLVAIAATVRRVPGEEVVRWALLASAGFVAVALAVELGTGAFQPAGYDYRFSGVYHPNTLATFCAVLALAAAALAPRSAHRWLLHAAVAAALVLLVLTRSRTSLAAVLLALPLQRLAAARPSRAVLAVLAVAWASCLALLVGGEALLPRLADAFLMDRTEAEVGSFTGRTWLWAVLLDRVAERPVLGYGLGGFWTPANVQDVYRAAGWVAAHAHSTYVEQLLQVGVVGLALYVASVVLGVGRGLVRLHRTGDPAPAFITSLLVYGLLLGALETVDPSPRFLTFLFFWSVAFLAFRDAPPSPGSARCAST